MGLWWHGRDRTVSKKKSTKTSRARTDANAVPAHAPPSERNTDRAAAGKRARRSAPLLSHAELDTAADRDPVGLLLHQAESRVPDLVPVRHGRMLVSPFTYYRGAALPMAADLARTPTSGLRVQLCGDAHLANFGAFASPERRLVFDVNDFDETLPGPVRVGRQAAWRRASRWPGATTGSRCKQRQRIVLAAVRSYRDGDARPSPRSRSWTSGTPAWTSRTRCARFKSQIKAGRYKRTEAMLAKARTSDSMQALGKLTTVVDGHAAIVSDPPLIVPIEELFADVDAERDLRARCGRCCP